MNYLIVEESRKKIYEYLDKIQKLEEEIQSSISVLHWTLSTPEEKDRTWQNLEKMAESIGNKIVKELHELKNTYFSVESDRLNEGKMKLIDRYQNLLEALNKKKSFIAEQRRKKNHSDSSFSSRGPSNGVLLLL